MVDQTDEAVKLRRPSETAPAVERKPDPAVEREKALHARLAQIAEWEIEYGQFG